METAQRIRFKYETLASVYVFLSLAFFFDLPKKFKSIKVIYFSIMVSKLQKPFIGCVKTTHLRKKYNVIVYKK